MLLLLVVTPHFFIGQCEASVWSYMAGTGNNDNDNNKKNDDDDVLVSSIVNREIQVAIKAPWPTSSQHNVLCEAYQFLKGQDRFLFLDALVNSHGRDDLNTFDRATEYAIRLYNTMIGFSSSSSKSYGVGDNDTDDGGGGAGRTNSNSIVTNTNGRLLHVALTMRASAPACELHRTLAYDGYPELVQYLEAFAVIVNPHHDDEDEDRDGIETEYDDYTPPTIIQTSMDLPESVIDMPQWTPSQRRAVLLPGEVIRQGDTIIENDDEDKNNIMDDDDGSTSTVPAFVILYAQLGGHSFPTFYRELVQRNIPFVVRHMGAGSGNGSDGSDPFPEHETVWVPETVLQGYGVRLDIRNVEYKVFDEGSKHKGESTQTSMINLTGLSSNTADDTTDGKIVDEHSRPHGLTTQFLAGVNLTALGLPFGDDDNSTPSNIHDLQKQLWILHEKYDSHHQLIPPNWQRRQLSLQAATVIANSNQPLLTLQDVSQNLPSVASTLVHVTVPPEIEAAAAPFERTLQRLIRTSGGGLWINGRSMNVERPSFNVFEMIKLLQEETEELDTLAHKLKSYLEPETAMVALNKIQQAWIQGESFFTTKSTDGGNTDGDDDEYEDDDNPADDGSRKDQFRIDLATGDDAVLYVNDIEKDGAYAHLGQSVQRMLIAMQYGMPPSVRRNLFTVVIVDDPSSSESNQNPGRSLMASLSQNQFPARLAVVIASKDDIAHCTQWMRTGEPKDDKPCPIQKDYWLTSDEEPTVSQLKKMKVNARDIHRLYAYMRDNFAEQSNALVAYESYVGQLLHQNPPSNGEYYSLFDLFEVHNELLLAFKLLDTKMSPNDIASSLQQNEENSKHSYARAVRFAVDKGIHPGMSFVNGRPLPLWSDEDSGEKISKIFAEEQQLVFGSIVNREITDTHPRNYYYKLIKGKKKNVFPKLHPLLTAPSSGTAFAYIDHTFGNDSLMTPKSMAEQSPLEADVVYLFEAVLELDTQEGLSYALDFLNVVDDLRQNVGGSTMAAKFRVLPSTESAARTELCQLFSEAGRVDLSKIKSILAKLISNPDDAPVELGSMIANTPESFTSCSNLQHLQHSLPSKNFISANGRVYSMAEASIDTVDIELLSSIDLDTSKIVTGMLKNYVDQDLTYDAVGRTCAFLSTAKGATEKRAAPDQIISFVQSEATIEKNRLEFSWNSEIESEAGLRISVTAVVDPVTETAQRLSPLLVILRDVLKLPMTLFLAPRLLLNADSNIPITSYYRFVADPSSYQGLTGSRSPIALFSNLPSDHVLTLRMDVPESWDVQQLRAIQDTDNLRCDLRSGCGDESQSGIPLHHRTHVTHVDYSLKHLLFFGQCFETTFKRPNGLQLVLSKSSNDNKSASKGAAVEIEPDGSIRSDKSVESVQLNDHYADTLVMETVGYWQLRANPGVWNLQINQMSRGADIFQMVDGYIRNGRMQVGRTIPNSKKRLVMGDFAGNHGELLLVKRKAGYEKASLFYDKNSITSDGDDVVHVFSLATGHLYERFLKIMMLSVTKRTSSKVKFWLFENFLSPTFKTSSIAMAKRIGCDVEFVTYKWPEWLRGQSEKQRIIWGYKILFLDVLFPLNVKKIIYVDADQVVRGDLKELWNMDLQGAPYGYTPFCTSNEATLGFQFWRQGFCKCNRRRFCFNGKTWFSPEVFLFSCLFLLTSKG